MTKTTIIAALTLAVLATEAPAQSTTTFYNSNGQSIGRAMTSGNTTTFQRRWRPDQRPFVHQRQHHDDP